MASARDRLSALEEALSQVIRGKAEVLRLATVCLLAKGHLLIEDVPGVGKTTLAQALARVVDCRFHRLQFTADMLPSDILGVTIYNAQTQALRVQARARSSPTSCSPTRSTAPRRKRSRALLEAMNERQVTIDGRSYPLPSRSW